MNVTMMHMRMILAATFETRSIVSLSITENPHITEATRSDSVPNVRMSVRLRRLMRWYMDVTTTPAIVETKVARSMGMKISVGLAAPSCAR